jgi:hypothetical protein
MKLAEEQKTKMCNTFYKRYPHNKINNKYKVMEIEHCNYSCADFISDVSKLPEIDMEKYLDIFFFQIIYTILSIQKVYPYFAHNDLFMRNEMGLDIDGVWPATINVARKNYALLTDKGKVKLTGNSIKSKKLPLYIEVFLDKAVKLLLEGKGQEFIEYYYEYVN